MWNEELFACALFVINIPFAILVALLIGYKLRKMMRDSDGINKNY